MMPRAKMIWRSVQLRSLVGTPNPVFDEETGFLRLIISEYRWDQEGIVLNVES